IAVGRNINIMSQNKYSVAFGDGITLNNDGGFEGWSFASGELLTSRGAGAVTFGYNNSNRGHSEGNNYNFVFGTHNSTTNVGGALIGNGLTADSISTVVVGQSNTTYAGNNGGVNQPLQPIFIVGNGTISTNFASVTRSDAFKILL